MKKIFKVIFVILFLFSIFRIYNVSAHDTIFEFTKIEVKEKTDGVEVNDVSINDGALTNDIVFTNKDDYIKYNLYIKNTSEENYIIKSIEDNNESEYLEYIYNVDNIKIVPGEEKIIEMQIKYVEELVDYTISDQTVNLSITYIKDDGEIVLNNITTSDNEINNITIGDSITTSESNITNTKGVKGTIETNPKTIDNIKLYILIGIISIIGLVITSVSKKKITKFFMILSIFSTIILPMSVKANNDEFLISINNNIKVKLYKYGFSIDNSDNIAYMNVPKGSKVHKPISMDRSGYKFDGWYTDEEGNNPFDFKNDKITSDTVFYGFYRTPCSDFEEASWSTIVANFAKNPDYYDAGCTKDIEMDSDDDGIKEKYQLRLINTTIDDRCSEETFSQTACGPVLEFVTLLPRKIMNTTRTNVGGWRDGLLRVYVNDDIYNKLPSDLRQYILDTRVISGHGTTEGEENFVTTDKLYFLSSYEIWGVSKKTTIGSNETRRLDYYKKFNSNIPHKYADYGRTDNQTWWLRDANSTTNTKFKLVGYEGIDSDGNVANTDYHVSPIFRIGNN